MSDKKSEINSFIDKKNLEIEHRNFMKYNHLYNICINILKKYKNGVVLYGGFALNELLPSELKFYNNETLKDIDILCNINIFEKIKTELLYTYKKKGYPLITIKEALHYNTYKLIVDGVQIMDLSHLDKESFKAIQYGGVETSLGLRTANIDFLKYTVHLLLSKPEDAFRWNKVYPRMIKLYSIYPPKPPLQYNFEDFVIEKVPPIITQKIKEFISKTQLTSFGWDVIDFYLQEPYFKKGSPVLYLSTKNDSIVIAKQLLDYLKDSDFTILETVPENIFVSKHTVITYKGSKWIYIFDITTCYSYIWYKSMRIFSIHSIITNLYGLYLSTNDSRLYNIVNILSSKLLNNLSSKKKLFEQLIMDCYGHNKGLITLRREHFARLNK